MKATSSTSTWQQVIDQAVEDAFAEMVEVRRHLHAHPEPSGEEHQTSMYLYQRLADHGIGVHIGPEGCGVIADPVGAAEGPRIALRADIDALRIQDEKQVDYRSQVPGVMHACAHDAHAATLLGALLALKQLQDSGQLPWPLCWRGIFQPAEETSEGALKMVEAGVLEGVDGIFSLHADPGRPLGRLGLRWGPLTANCDAMELDIRGRGGHAARPHESLDPIATAAQLISSIYLFVPRAVDSQEAVVVTIGQIIGGDNPNVIPEHVVLRGTLRTLREEVRQQTKDHIAQLARGLAHASGTEIDVRFDNGPQSVFNDKTMTDLLLQAGASVVGQENVDKLTRTSMGGEDFSHYLTKVPGSMFRLGSASTRGGSHPLHSPLFDIDEDAMKIGARVLAASAVLWSNPERQAGKVSS